MTEGLKTISKTVTVGFEETNDAVVTVSPAGAGSGIAVELSTPVKRQYGEHLEQLIGETVKGAGYTDLCVKVQDKGAWDYALKARIMAALKRGAAQ